MPPSFLAQSQRHFSAFVTIPLCIPGLREVSIASNYAAREPSKFLARRGSYLVTCEGQKTLRSLSISSFIPGIRPWRSSSDRWLDIRSRSALVRIVNVPNRLSASMASSDKSDAAAVTVTPKDVVDFWFGAVDLTSFGKDPRWFRKDPAFDDLIRERFLSAVEALPSGALDSWKTTPTGILAFIIVADQFPRNLFRDSPKAFSSDPLAMAASQEAVQTGLVAQLPPIQRMFAYMPYMHSESLTVQREGEALWRALAAEYPIHFDANIKFHNAHQNIIERFGRFPHRNQVLGRVSTPEEIKFLATPGSSF